MAEDSMEIVLESSNSHVLGNEHDDADDFLEIDIDLPHGFTDEDDMIEDAPQLTGMDQTDVGVSFDNTDDYMLDDDHQEVSYETNDELMYEEDGGETEAPSHSYVNVEDPIFSTFVDSTTPGNNNRETNNQTFEQDGPAALTTTSVSLDTTRTGSPLPIKEESDLLDDPTDGVHPQYEDVEKFVHDDHEHVEYENVSYHGEENEGEGLTETVEQGHWDDNYTEGVDGENLDSNHDSATPEQQGIHDEPGLRQIKVWYQNTAYQLFDNGSGDPEQYFLDDLWLSVSPIKAIIQGISQVIGGELGDDEEICLHFRDFGLEIEESTCENVNISLAVILSMHKRFIENGNPADLSGAYEQNPLCIYLATRARFEDRFQKLYDGAAEKKSLTDTLARHDSETPGENENAEHDDNTAQAEGVLNKELNQERVDDANATADDKSIVADGETVTDNDVKVKVDTAAQQHEGDRSHTGHEEQTESKELYANAGEAVTGDETEGLDKKVNEISSSVLLDELASPVDQDAASPLVEPINNEQAELVNSPVFGEVEPVANNEEASGGIVQVTETVSSGHSPKSNHSEAANSVSENQEKFEEVEDWEEHFQEVAQNPHDAKHLNDVDVDEDEESHKTEDHPYDDSYAQHDDTIIDATTYNNHEEESGFNDNFVSAADEVGVNEVDVIPPIDDDEIDFGLDDDEPQNREPENATIFENDEIPIAWSSAAGINSESQQTEADLVDDTATTGTLSANGVNQSKVDEDEITYDDDDLEPDLRTPVKTEFASLPGKDASAKRSWGEAEDEHDASTSIVGDAKRIRA